MSFNLPTFNLNIRWWRDSAQVYPPNGGRAGAHNGTGNLRMLKTAFGIQTLNFAAGVMFLLVPHGTDIRPGLQWGAPAAADIIECPTGSNRWYQAQAVDDVARGFANEYRVVLVTQYYAPVPIP